MAWVYTKQIFGREYRDATTGRYAKRIYQCLSDTEIDDLIDVLDNAALPVKGDPYEVSSPGDNLVVVDLVPREVEREKFLYEVEVNYATPTGYEHNPNLKPWERPWEISWTKTTIEEEMRKTIETVEQADLPADTWFDNITCMPVDSPVKNSTGDPYDPRISHTVVIPQVTLSRFYQTIGNPEVELILGSVDCCNDDDVAIADLGGLKWQFKIDDASITRVYEDGIQCYRVSYVVSWHPRLWIAYVLDAGYNEFDEESGATGTRKIRDTGGVEVSSPFPLNGAGRKLPLGDPEEYFGFGNHYLIDFDTLGLPTTMEGLL